jgi:enoyl-CoA hydratase
MTARSASTVRRDAHGAVLVVTIDRPERRNAIDAATAAGLAEAMAVLDDRDELSVGIVTGAAGTFCAGMDLKAFLDGERPVIEGKGFAGLVEAPPLKPLIAAVEGYALAGGCEIVLACDLVVAAEDARFGLPEVKRWLTAAVGGLVRLPRLIPQHLAMEIALTGDLVPAPRMAAAGLVNVITAPGEALSAALALANKIAGNAPLAVRASKQVITQSRDWSGRELFERQRAITSQVNASEDAREGARAFTERRAPRWSGT